MSRPSIRILIAALVAIVASPAIAQSAAPAASTVRLTGTVYDPTGAPLNDIQVTLYRNGVESDIAQTRSNETGRFTFPAVPKSTTTRYSLEVEDLSGHHVPVHRTPTFTAGSAKVPDVTMALAGFITGKVTMKDGDVVKPATGVLVTAENKTGVGAEGTPTAANGAFRMGGLRPGSYELMFQDVNLNFADACYDNVPLGEELCDGTTRVTVTAGNVTTINPQVLDNPLEQASGTVTDSKGAPLADVQVIVWDADDSTRGLGSTYTDSKGNWTVGAIDHAGPIKVKVVDESGAHATRWYRNAKTFGTATRVTLPDGGEIVGLKVVLPLG